MVELELLNKNNEKYLLEIQPGDVPLNYVEPISYTLKLGKYGKRNKLKGQCSAIKYDEQYVGLLLIGEAIENLADPEELKGTAYFRLIGFLIDSRYRQLGIGSLALKQAIHNIYTQYGKVPILLECHKENIGALNFYLKIGFRNTYLLHNEDYFLIFDYH